MADTFTLPHPGDFNTPDRDIISFNLTDGQQGKITFSLSTVPRVTWWKGIKIFGDGTWNAVGLLETQNDNHGPVTQSFDMSQFSDIASRLEFWKAKTFGIHTDIVHYTFEPG